MNGMNQLDELIQSTYHAIKSGGGGVEVLTEFADCVRKMQSAESAESAESKSIQLIHPMQSCTVYHNVMTVSGYKFDVAKSALQKFIRRGDFENALHMAIECHCFRFLNGGAGSFTNFINRLKVICLEDIGPAFPVLICHVSKLMSQYQAEVEVVESKILPEIIWLLCNSPHGHFYSHVRAAAKLSVIEPLALWGEPNLVFDLDPVDETIYRKLTFYLWSGIKLKHMGVIYTIQQMMAIHHPNQKTIGMTGGVYIGKNHRIGFLIFAIVEHVFKHVNADQIFFDILTHSTNWYKKLTTDEDWLCIVHPIYCYIMQDRLYLGKPCNSIKPPIVLNSGKILLPEWVFDQHTSTGRSLKRNLINFAVEGSLVSFQDAKLMNYEGVYRENRIKFPIKNSTECVLPPRESDEYTFIARAQITTGSSKTDVYFARGTDGSRVVVKGPFMSYAHVHMTFQINSLSKLFPQVNSINASIRLLIVNEKLGGISTPMGLRVEMVNKPGYFLIMDDLYGLETYPVKMHPGSVKWPPVEVVDWSKVGGQSIPSKMTDEGNINFLIQLAYRYIFKFGDFAQRNFINRGNLVYNLDMDRLFVNNVFRISANEKNILADVYGRYSDQINDVLREWLGDGVMAMPRWSMIDRIFNLGDERVKEIIENIQRLITSKFGDLHSPNPRPE